MKHLLAALWLASGCLSLGRTSHAQSTTEAAKAEGKAFAREKAAAAQGAATTAPDAERIPNFGGVPGQSDYFDDPDRMSREAASQATSNTGYRTMRDSMERRARFAPVDLDATIARSLGVSEDPLSYTSGMAIGGTQGRCVPLPPGSGSAGRYTATCNVGYAIASQTQSCAIPLRATVERQATYKYYAEVPFHTGIAPSIAEFSGALADGTCENIGTADGCQVVREYGLTPNSRCARFRFDIVQCRQPLAGLSGAPLPATGESWFAQEVRTSVSTARDESACASLAADPACSSPTEICTDSDPVTRTIEGVDVTAPCWAWRRDYQCTWLTPAQDCDALASTPGCRLVREDCITEETPCKTLERVYDCPLPEQTQSPNQFICDGDVYCIDGSCETIEREANDEFKDAAVALNAMGQARREWDPDTLTLFKGERETCSSKVFGVLNCCKGKGFPLIPGIQFLVLLGCSRKEVLLHQRDAQGLCAYVGTYCSDSVLGVCLTKKKVYCCFESKLSRILQEQGRQQLSKPWAKPKAEQCLGFTIDEFARLDLSQMDFSEVYAEFTEAARLPDELQAATDIQQKIEDYYARARQ
jgi:conjugal transfer mating pair stabilization protein TraN